jgi:hypothetical protein
MGDVDARQKVLLGRDELNDSLRRLVADDLVVQRAGGRFSVPTASDPQHPSFEPLDDDAYMAAIASYQARFVETLRDLDDDRTNPESPAWPKLSGEWRFPDEHYASDLEMEGLWSRVGQIVEALNAQGFVAEPGPASVGPGTIEFSIYARSRDDADAMLRIARPQFAAAAPPPGSMIEVKEWDPTSIGPSMAQVAHAIEREFAADSSTGGPDAAARDIAER